MKKILFALLLLILPCMAFAQLNIDDLDGNIWKQFSPPMKYFMLSGFFWLIPQPFTERYTGMNQIQKKKR